MKKFKVILAILAVFAMLFTVVFADGEDYDLTADFDGTNVTVKMLATKDITIDMYSTVAIAYDNTVWEYVSATSSVNDEFINVGEYVTWSASVSKNANVKKGDSVFELVFKLKDGKEANGAVFAPNDSTWIMSEGADSTVGSATVLVKTDVVVEPQANKDVEGYTDVVNFVSSAKATSGTTLSFDLYENDSLHKNYSVNLGDWGLIIEEGTINFKVAIIGAPATGVTLRNPVVK